LPTNVTPRSDHIVFYLRGAECRADSVDAQVIASGNWQLWRHGIVDAVTKRLLAKQITGYGVISYVNGDKCDLRRKNLRNSRTAFWSAKFALRCADVKIRFCKSRLKWIVRRQVSGVRLWKSCSTEVEARTYAQILSRVGAAELCKYKKSAVLDEQMLWLQEDVVDHIVRRCDGGHEIAQKAFAAGVMAREFIGKRNAEAICG
jgi:hypothetical protein